MNLFERTCEILGEELDVFSPRVEIVGFKKIAVLCTAKILSVSEGEISLLAKKMKITIVGKELAISKSQCGEVYLVGDIDEVRREKI